MFAVTLLGAEKVQVERIAVFCQPDRSFVEEGGPLEGCTVQTLTLGAVAVFGVDWIAVVFELDYVQERGKVERVSSGRLVEEQKRDESRRMYVRFPHQHLAVYFTLNSFDSQQ